MSLFSLPSSGSGISITSCIVDGIDCIDGDDNCGLVLPENNNLSILSDLYLSLSLT